MPGRQWGGVPGAGPEAAGSSLGLASGACGSLGPVSARRCVSCVGCRAGSCRHERGLHRRRPAGLCPGAGLHGRRWAFGGVRGGRAAAGSGDALRPASLNCWASGGRDWAHGAAGAASPRGASVWVRPPSRGQRGLTSLVFRRHPVGSQDHSQLSGNGPAHGVRAQGRAAQGRGEQGGGPEVSRTVPVAGPGRPPSRSVPALWADPPGRSHLICLQPGKVTRQRGARGPRTGGGGGRQPRPACLGEACACPAPSTLVQ